MRKKVSLLLIVLLGVIMTLTLVACNTTNGNPSDLPDRIDPDTSVDLDGNLDMKPYLTFEFTTQATSVFKSIYVDEAQAFIESVKYCVIYTDGALTIEGQKGFLTVDMLDETSKELITKSGHHMITAEVALDGDKKASGSFALHLMDRSESVEKVMLTFKPQGEQNIRYGFGSVGASSSSEATVYVDKGTTFKSWDDFVNTFPMRSLDGNALQEVEIDGKKISSTNFSTITFNKNTTVKTVWTENIYTVRFNLCVPDDATLIDGKQSPEKEFTQIVARGAKATTPESAKFNVYNGYYFAGWYLDANGNGKWDDNDSVWSFSKPINSDNISLVGRWTSRAYSFTLYTMGGNFSSNVTNSICNNRIISSDDIAKEEGLTVIDATSSFSIKDGNLQNIVMTGFGYDHKYSDYIIKVKPFANDDKVVYLTLADIVKNLVKGSTNYTKVENVYSDYQCTQTANLDKVSPSADGSDGVGYVKWVFNEPDSSAANYSKECLERLSSYYTDVLFKGGIFVKADGSIRLDKIADESVSEIIIPAEIKYEGATRPITEISANACMNLKALVKIDMSKATNLTTIGDEAFKHCNHLNTVVMPENGGNIAEMGREIFAESAFENDYADSGKNAIIVGGVLYKYVAKDASQKTNIDLGEEEFASVTRISDGAFADCTNLVGITLGKGIKTIDNGAFENLKNFTSITVPADNALTYIGESAFDGTPFITTSSNCYNSELKAIIVGNIYYRFIDTKATIATISGVTHIAPSAFLNRSNVESINISAIEEEKIVYIGRGAFAGTKWLQRSDNNSLHNGYIIINGMLCDYPGNNGENLTIPSDIGNIDIIGDAFYSSAQAVRTIKFGANVKKIDDYAFRGMSIAESFIFSEVTVGDGKLEGAPQISQNAFADSNGKLVNNAKFYFSEKVMDYFKALNDGSVTTTDDATLSWLKLYSLNTSSFVAEKIDAVWIDQNIMPSVLLNTAKGGQETALVQLSNTSPDLFKNALIVMGNTGVTRCENLSLTGNNVQLVKISMNDTDFGKWYEEGVDKYVVTFTYAGETTGCHIKATDANVYIVTVVNAVYGNPSFYNSQLYAANGKPLESGANYYIDGFEQKAGVSTPTFYTSFDNVDGFKFYYKDVDEIEHYLDVDVNGFDVGSVKSAAVATFTVDFYGIGEYRFTLTYNVEEAKVDRFEQVGAISLPLNSNANDAIRKFTVDLVGEDGNRERVALSSTNGFTFDESLNTTTFGLHEIEVQYLSQKVDNVKTGTIVYSVVLEANENLFTYEAIDATTARIVSCSATSASTIVIPATCTINGKEYNVTRIGTANASKGVFEGFDKLKAIYLTSNIKFISNNSFKDCVLLQNVYTAQKEDAPFVTLTDAHWKTVGEETDVNGVKYHNVVVNSLENVEIKNDVLAIAAQYKVTIDKTEHVYTVIGVELSTPVSANEVFLPDTIKQRVTITLANGGNPNMYSSESGLMFTTAERFASSVVEIGNNAFLGCQNLKNIDLSDATSLERIGACAFSGSGLTTIDLSRTKLTEIENQVFEGCSSLVEVTLPNSVTSIYAQAFKNCGNLETLTAKGVKYADPTAYEQTKLENKPGLN